MAFFRLKDPIEAVQFVPDKAPEAMGGLKEFYGPSGFTALFRGETLMIRGSDGNEIEAVAGDWILRDAAGAISKCPAADFARLYELVPKP